MRGLDSLVETLAQHLSDRRDQPILLMLGSGISLPDGSAPGVPGAATLAAQATAALAHAGVLNDAEQGIVLSYQDAFARLISIPGGQAIADQIVRAAVLSARISPNERSSEELATVNDTKAAEIEADTACWGLPGGLKDLGTLLTRYPRAFGNVVLTTNFDPLLETAIRRAAGRAMTLAIDDGNGFRHVLTSDGKVVHLHGYWFGSHTLHSEAQLVSRHISEFPKEKDGENYLTADLHRLLKSKHVVVVGYGGWKDVFMHALGHSAATGETQVSWCLFEQDELAAEKIRNKVLLHLGPAGNCIEFYRGIAGNSFGSALRDAFEAIRPADDLEQFLRCLLRSITAEPQAFLNEQQLSNHMRPLMKFGDLDIVKAAFACVEFHIAHANLWQNSSSKIFQEIDLGPIAIRDFLTSGKQHFSNNSAIANLQFDDLGRPDVLLPLVYVHRAIACYQESANEGTLAQGYPNSGIYYIAKEPYWVFAIKAIHAAFRMLAGYGGGILATHVVNGLINAMYSALVDRKTGQLPDGPIIPWQN